MTSIEQPSDPNILLHMHFSSDPVVVGDVTMSIVAAIDHLHLSEQVMGDFEIIVTEVINNISEHAYSGDTDGLIEVLVSHVSEYINFHFIDRGAKMPGGEIPEGNPHNLDVPADNLPEGGFGWFLIRNLASDLRYERIKNENHFKFQILVGVTN